MCVGDNGWIYFFRSSSSNPRCTSGYAYIYNSNYIMSGFALGSGYYSGRSSSVYSKVSKVAPVPDTFDPKIEHTSMLDSHSKDRTFSFSIGDEGDPASGLNVTAAAGVGPTLYYTITDADGIVNA
jgi:hypothetical protein